MLEWHSPVPEMPLLCQWQVNNCSLSSWCDFMWRIARRFSNGVQEKHLNLSECTALSQGHFRNLVLYRCGVAVCCQQGPALFLSTSYKFRQDWALGAGGSNLSRGWVPGSLTSETRTKDFLSFSSLWKAQQIVALYCLIYCFPPVFTSFSISIWVSIPQAY